jgi:hypothetical protein
MFSKISPISYCCFFLGCALIAAACGEKVPLKNPQSAYDITYSGNLYIGQRLKFQSNAPAGSTYLWKFGDGHVSTQVSPEYTYYSIAHNGTTIIDDTVTLIINNDIYRPNYKFFKLKPNVNDVAGNHVWKGGYFSVHGNCCPGLTDHSLADTSFVVSPIDEYAVGAWSGKLVYLADSNYYSNERSSTRYNATWLRYTKDTLFFMQRSGTVDGYAQTTYFHKY